MKKVFLLLILLLIITSCKTDSYFDSWTGLTEDKFDETIFGLKTNYDNISLLELDKDHLDKLLSDPPPVPIGNGDLISFSITEDVSLKDVFIELGRLADIDIQLDPKINKSIIFKVTEKPVNVVVDKICDLAGLKYEYFDGILKVERDLPYTINYDVDILVGHELWDTIQESINYILDIYQVEKQDDFISSDGIAIQDTSNFEQKISINKPAGIISVHANNKAQKSIKKYIEQAKRNYSSQVIIEAKVIEVTLNDSFQSGIDWSLGKDILGTEGQKVRNNIAEYTGNPKVAEGLKNITFAIPFGKSGLNLNIVASFLSKFGKTKTLQSPRISALNNQKAILEFLNSIVYFSIENDTTAGTGGAGNTTTQTSTKQETEEGVTLSIVPTINTKTREITLSVVPELKSLNGFVDDPVNKGNKVPIIQRRKLETSLKLKSGEVMVIGGLISESVNKQRYGIPILMDIPILNYITSYKSNEKKLNETVIFIKATIVDEQRLLGDSDRKMLDNLDFKK